MDLAEDRGQEGSVIRGRSVLALTGRVRTWRFLLLAALALLGGCATTPVGPNVMALPGSDKTLDQFRADDVFCRQWAAKSAQETAQGASAGQYYGSDARQQWYDMAYLQCMYSKGNRIPGVVTGSPALPPPPPNAPPPPGISPPAGAEPSPKAP